uniref:Uncharacterized protein n=1 Tax=Rhizophagus irregularis (strain DAOM 181602 / DAOM 197198 / MUCL 43194) TaxID=747089 RepID=U9TS66_RHIID
MNGNLQQPNQYSIGWDFDIFTHPIIIVGLIVFYDRHFYVKSPLSSAGDLRKAD